EPDPVRGQPDLEDPATAPVAYRVGDDLVHGEHEVLAARLDQTSRGRVKGDQAAQHGDLLAIERLLEQDLGHCTGSPGRGTSPLIGALHLPRTRPTTGEHARSGHTCAAPSRTDPIGASRDSPDKHVPAATFSRS